MLLKTFICFWLIITQSFKKHNNHLAPATSPTELFINRQLNTPLITAPSPLTTNNLPLTTHPQFI